MTNRVTLLTCLKIPQGPPNRAQIEARSPILIPNRHCKLRGPISSQPSHTMPSIRSLVSAILLASSLPLVLTDEPRGYFGNKDGNFQPAKASRPGGSTNDFTGGQVYGPNAVYSINNQDGIGGGSDTYTLYCGNGDAFPPKSSWVSFEQMWVLFPLRAPPRPRQTFFSGIES